MNAKTDRYCLVRITTNNPDLILWGVYNTQTHKILGRNPRPGPSLRKITDALLRLTDYSFARDAAFTTAVMAAHEEGHGPTVLGHYYGTLTLTREQWRQSAARSNNRAAHVAAVLDDLLDRCCDGIFRADRVRSDPACPDYPALPELAQAAGLIALAVRKARTYDDTLLLQSLHED